MIREYKLFLQDILDAINDIDSFVKEMDFRDFCKDEGKEQIILTALPPANRFNPPPALPLAIPYI